MRNFILWTLCLSFLTSLTYGNAMVPEDRIVSVARPAARDLIIFSGRTTSGTSSAILVDLTLEPRLLHPYSTEFQMPWFWRVDYEQGTKHNTIFLLGSAHGIFPTQSLPFSVLKHMGYADELLSEIGEKVLLSVENSVEIDCPIETALKKDGTYFGHIDAGDADGWLKMVPDYLREPFRNIIKRNLKLWEFDEEVVSHFQHYDPRLFAQLLEIYNEAQLKYRTSLAMHGAFGEEIMDRKISVAFNSSKKPILALEDELVRKECARKALKEGQVYGIHTVESDIETLRISLMVQPEDDELRKEAESKMAAEHVAFEYAKGVYTAGYGMPDEEDKTDYCTDFRNQYWIEHTLSQALHSKGPTLVMVGNAHLDWGWIEHIGKTGLLNFFQKLYNTDTAWHGAKITSIQRLVGVNPRSRLTSERNQSHWVPETVSDEGPYLERLIGTLRSGDAPVSAASGARAGAGV